MLTIRLCSINTNNDCVTYYDTRVEIQKFHYMFFFIWKRNTFVYKAMQKYA